MPFMEPAGSLLCSHGTQTWMWNKKNEGRLHTVDRVFMEYYEKSKDKI
jgi:hypothetical protein